MARRAPQGTQAIQRALSLYRSFSAEQPEHRLTDLATAHGLHPSTAHRLLGVLEAEGLVGRNPDTQGYRWLPDSGFSGGERPVRRNGLRRLEPLRTPFHRRTEALCESDAWRDWSGYTCPLSYEPLPDHEYWAIRNTAALIDVSPLFKYEIVGPDAERLLDWVMTRDFTKSRAGRVMYTSWCNEEGHLLQDGNVQRLARERFLVSAAEPCLRWFEGCGLGLEVEVRDVSTDLGVLALQGPRARAIAEAAFQDVDFAAMRYFDLASGELGDLAGEDRGVPVTVTRTGYTGDLGYECWVAAEDAEALWDALAAAGADHGLRPAGLLALDMVRVEAGLVLIDVDYVSASHAEIEVLKVTPAEAGLGFTVKLDKEADFVGRRALELERERGPAWALVGLEVDWFELERLWAEIDLRPQVVGEPASREPTPVFAPGGLQVGQCTTRFFSPLLKKYIGLATVHADVAALGTALEFEVAVGYGRRRARARVAKRPFFHPARKTAVGSVTDGDG
ncbi:MAG: helix-turn-helix domain-containing protein [Acidobacteria bacterium]|nr:helix-turn-helix domain-containing protein [Acidobacteriota bacterium]